MYKIPYGCETLYFGQTNRQKYRSVLEGKQITFQTTLKIMPWYRFLFDVVNYSDRIIKETIKIVTHNFNKNSGFLYEAWCLN